MSPAAPARGPLRALAEVLRAPLLLSPTADVLAGYMAVQAAGPATDHRHEPRALAVAALMGTALLGAGMAQNALADLDDDRARKPSRPLPAGDLSPGAVRATFTLLTLGALALATLAAPASLPTVGAIVVLSAAYHYLTKGWRVAGCINLGLLRGLDLGLGILAACLVEGRVADGLLPLDVVPAPALVVAGLYAALIGGASLHASTDDETGGRAVSRVGLGLHAAALLTQGLVLSSLVPASPLALVAAWGLIAWALVRLGRATRRLPPPAITGTALSNLFFAHAAVCVVAPAPAGPLAALVVVGLAILARRLMGAFPPS